MRPEAAKIFLGLADRAAQYNRTRHSREGMKIVAGYIAKQPAVQDAFLKAAVSPTGQKVTGTVVQAGEKAGQLPVVGKWVKKLIPPAETPVPLSPEAEAALGDLVRKAMEDGTAHRMTMDWGQ